jgi:DNA-nicking Smr family endonuclease
MKKFSLPVDAQESILCSQLVKHNIKYSQAVAVSKLLVAHGSGRALTEAESQLTQQVCRQWLEQRQRQQRLEVALEHWHT